MKRKKQQLSCASCRNLKRRCSRDQPCSQCERTRRPCQYEEEEGDSGDDSIVELLNDYSFVNALLSVWFREMDYMYESFRATEVEVLWQKQELDGKRHPEYMPLLAATLALTAQLHWSDLTASVAALYGPWSPSSCLVTTALTLAEEQLSSVLAAAEEHLDCVPESLQASLLVCSFYKNTGQANRYRANLYFYISSLLNLSYHLLDSFPCDEGKNMPLSISRLSIEQRSLVRRIFWTFFACDRLYIMIGGPSSSYCINTSHCDIWLHEGPRSRHISDLIPSSRQKCDFQKGPKEGGVSPFIWAMTEVAAVAGQCTDSIARLRCLQAETRRRCVGMSMEEFREACIRQVSEIEALVDSLHAGKINDARQRHVLVLTIFRLRRDIALALSSLLPLPLAGPYQTWLRQKEMDSARALLLRGFEVPKDVAPRAMGWIFYLHYLAEPVLGLLKALSHDISNIADADVVSIFEAVLKGRNLICLVARESRVSLASDLARKVCGALREDGVLKRNCSKECEAVGDANIQIDTVQVCENYLESRSKLTSHPVNGHETTARASSPEQLLRDAGLDLSNLAWSWSADLETDPLFLALGSLFDFAPPR